MRLLAALVILMFGVVMVVTFAVWLARERALRAVQQARWEPHAQIEGDDVVVDVRRVARWGRHEQVIGPPVVIARVPSGDLSDDALLEARTLAVIRAETYNAMGAAP